MKNNLIFTVLALSVVSTGLAMDKEKKDEGKRSEELAGPMRNLHISSSASSSTSSTAEASTSATAAAVASATSSAMLSTPAGAEQDNSGNNNNTYTAVYVSQRGLQNHAEIDFWRGKFPG